VHHTHILGLDLPGCRRRCGPVYQPLQLGQHPAPKPGHLRVFPLRQAPRLSDQMSQTGLALMHPVLGVVNLTATSAKRGCRVGR
jgi:hypothetical protein